MFARNCLVRLFFVAALAAAPAYAGVVTTIASPPERASLLELYTSEGCSSCPPAEAWFSQLKTDPRLWRQLVPVAFHVDYWDHLGWRDRFAKAEFSERQQEYQRANAIKVVYTPGLVLNGHEWRGWFDRKPISELAPQKVGVLEAKFSESGAAVEFTSLQRANAPLVLHVAWLGFDLATAVGGGENGGKTLKHDFTVLDTRALTQVAAGNHYSWRFEGKAPPAGQAPGSRAVALWVTELGDATPIQATGGWIP